MQKHQKPPRPPPLSVSQPANPPPLSVSQPANPPPLSVSQPSNPPPQPQPNQPPPQPNSRPSPRPNDNESPQSPLRLESPHQSDDHDYTKNSGANVSNEQYFSPLTSPAPQTPPKDSTTPNNFSSSTSASSPHQIVTFQSFHRKEEPPQAQSAVVLGGADTTQQQQEEGNGNGEGERKGRLGRGDKRTTRGGGGGGGVRFGGVKDIVRSSSKEDLIEKINLGVRVYEIVFCLISFSVMASDRTQGWSGDSFDRYKEYRFCLSVNILGFLYAAFQAYDVGNHLVTGKHVITHHLRYQFDFIMDQILAYLLISASSAAASRVDDWQANWGKDEFTAKASASVSMAFLAFLGFAMSSLISGYNLCNRDLT